MLHFHTSLPISPVLATQNQWLYPLSKFQWEATSPIQATTSWTGKGWVSQRSQFPVDLKTPAIFLSRALSPTVSSLNFYSMSAILSSKGAWMHLLRLICTWNTLLFHMSTNPSKCLSDIYWPIFSAWRFRLCLQYPWGLPLFPTRIL